MANAHPARIDMVIPETEANQDWPFRPEDEWIPHEKNSGFAVKRAAVAKIITTKLHTDIINLAAKESGLSTEDAKKIELQTRPYAGLFYKNGRFRLRDYGRLVTEACRQHSRGVDVRFYFPSDDSFVWHEALRFTKNQLKKLPAFVAGLSRFKDRVRLNQESHLELIRRHLPERLAGEHSMRLHFAEYYEGNPNSVHPEANCYVILERNNKAVATCGGLFKSGRKAFLLTNLQGVPGNKYLINVGWKGLLLATLEDELRNLGVERLIVEPGSEHRWAMRASEEGVKLTDRYDKVAKERKMRPVRADGKIAYYSKRLN